MSKVAKRGKAVRRLGLLRATRRSRPSPAAGARPVVGDAPPVQDRQAVQATQGASAAQSAPSQVARPLPDVAAGLATPLAPISKAAASMEMVPIGKDARVEARDAMKRVLPRYARINRLHPGMTWGSIQRSLQQMGFTLWRPSIKEKRAVVTQTVNPELPKSAGGQVYFRDIHLDDFLVFRPMGESCTSKIELLNQGTLVFQQKASALPALALAPPRGSTVIDACAAPGSKTSQLASLMQNDGIIYAFDRDRRRLDTLAQLMRQRGASCVEPRNSDFLHISPSDRLYANVTHILLDPSCSSSGMTKDPITDPAEVAELAANQRAIIWHAMRFPEVQRIAYSTCSVYEEENERVVESVLASPEGAGFQLADCLPFWARRGRSLFPGAERCVRTSLEDQTIGFFCGIV
uniref:SAM-dependent MTase RsmB/NOP-type domain-containing protein n=1 Tax=Pyrodinium bahamense TaxID=73915 RepID=A0A7S0AG58_9DINO|mmetsp:Transcript_33460/g.92657  ORF Transcript_33460/g.92657 Transcript_33460/m.92657 type:complete len:406 (+) Transcript_33460:73-1290(+)